MTFTNSKVVTGAAMSTGTYDTDLVLQAGEWELKKSVWTTNDYPGAITFFENRLLFGGSPSYPQTIWGSVVDDYENHDPGSSADADAETNSINTYYITAVYDGNNRLTDYKMVE